MTDLSGARNEINSTKKWDFPYPEYISIIYIFTNSDLLEEPPFQRGNITESHLGKVKKIHKLGITSGRAVQADLYY